MVNSLYFRRGILEAFVDDEVIDVVISAGGAVGGPDFSTHQLEPASVS